MKVDTTNVERRAENLTKQRETSSSESLRGELEIRYEGVTVTIGK